MKLTTKLELEARLKAFCDEWDRTPNRSPERSIVISKEISRLEQQLAAQEL